MATPTATRITLPPALLIGLVVVAFVIVAGSAMLHTSTTFDEIVFAAIGARGFHTGSFNLVLDHPRLPQYLFGFPAWLFAQGYPPETLANATGGLPEYLYARAFFWDAGNDPERLALAMRLVGLAFGALTVLATYVLSRRHLPDYAAIFAAVLVALMPDMLAHSGVAYTDVPLAFGFLMSVYALDAAVRDPSFGRVIFAALFCAFTVSLKYSGIVLAPVAVTLLAADALTGRWSDREWRGRVAIALPAFLVVTWLTLAIVGQGDWFLEEFIGRFQRSLHGTMGRDSFLWGTHYLGGRWYFFPVALALKTPAALHVMILVALAGAWIGWRKRPEWWMVVGRRGRAPAIGIAFFLAATLTTPLNIGTRHALPLVPLVCILVAQGLVPIWERGALAMRVTLGVLFAAFAFSGLRYYPYFISYLNEYASGREMYETLVDSSTDWGQGLIGLRDYMHERRIDSIALGYWGSAMPEGYGIRYATMPSYFPLEHPAVAPEVPRYLAVSASVLAGTVHSDPYADVRRVRPIAVVGGSIYIFDLGARRAPSAQ
jgi:Dolichyl-phosphate-mannose-protein mannosyltransferase